MTEAIDVVRRLFDAVQRRDTDAVLACYAPDVEIHEAAVLPYGGTYRGHEGALAHGHGFLAAWSAFQGPAEIRLDPLFWEDGEGSVCVLFRHRAFDPVRDIRLDEPEVSIYQVRDGHVVRSQMFHADSARVAAFLESVQPAGGRVPEQGR